MKTSHELTLERKVRNLRILSLFALFTCAVVGATVLGYQAKYHVLKAVNRDLAHELLEMNQAFELSCFVTRPGEMAILKFDGDLNLVCEKLETKVIKG